LGYDRIVVTSFIDLLGSRDVIAWSHDLDSPQTISYWWSFGTKPLGLFLTVSEIFNGECDAMVDVTLIRPLNQVKVHWPSSLAFCTDETAGRS